MQRRGEGGEGRKSAISISGPFFRYHPEFDCMHERGGKVSREMSGEKDNKTFNDKVCGLWFPMKMFGAREANPAVRRRLRSRV